MYDVTDAESFTNVQQWLHEIEKYASENVDKLLVGNKADLGARRAVTFEQGRGFADSLGMDFVETSAKSAQNVEKAFLTMSSKIKTRMRPKIQEAQGRHELNLSATRKVSPVISSSWFGCW